MLPLEVAGAGLGHVIVDHPHTVDDLLLDVRRAHNVELGEEVIGHGNEGVLGPALEPVHRAARDQPRELQRPTTELLANLETTITAVNGACITTVPTLNSCTKCPGIIQDRKPESKNSHHFILHDLLNNLHIHGYLLTMEQRLPLKTPDYSI